MQLKIQISLGLNIQKLRIFITVGVGEFDTQCSHPTGQRIDTLKSLAKV